MPFFETWLYTLKGQRRKIYKGASVKCAVDRLDTAAGVINEFRLDATVLVAQVDGMGVFQKVFTQKDYYRGKIEASKPARIVQ